MVAAACAFTSRSRKVCSPMSDDHMKATTESSIDRRTCCPSPVRSRASRALEIAWAAVMPVSLSGRIVRISFGRASSDPACTVVRPDSAWMSGS